MVTIKPVSSITTAELKMGWEKLGKGIGIDLNQTGLISAGLGFC